MPALLNRLFRGRACAYRPAMQSLTRGVQIPACGEHALSPQRALFCHLPTHRVSASFFIGSIRAKSEALWKVMLLVNTDYVFRREGGGNEGGKET